MPSPVLSAGAAIGKKVPTVNAQYGVIRDDHEEGSEVTMPPFWSSFEAVSFST